MSVRIEQPAAPRAQARRTSAPPVRRGAHDLNFERLRAPFSLRCGAVLIDYIVLVSIIAFATLLERVFGDGRRGGQTLLFAAYVVTAAVAMLNLVVLPAWTGRSLGKWATALRIERRNGAPLSIGRALLRHLVGYPLTLVTLGAGFLLAAFSNEGRALHDLLAGTVVVRSRASEAAYEE